MSGTGRLGDLVSALLQGNGSSREDLELALRQVTLFDLPSRERLLRIGAVATSKVCTSTCGDHILSVHVLPARSSLPLHSRGGTVTLRVLGPSSVVLRDFHVSSVESPSRGQAVISSNDGFILGEQDDCVCRGGMCPRQYGCVFWVEKQLRDNGKYYLCETTDTTLGQGSISVTRRQDVGPREVLNAADTPAVLLELLSAEEDVSADSFEAFRFYHQVKLSGSQQVKVTASSQAVGTAPMYIDRLL